MSLYKVDVRCTFEGEDKLPQSVKRAFLVDALDLETAIAMAETHAEATGGFRKWLGFEWLRVSKETLPAEVPPSL